MNGASVFCDYILGHLGSGVNRGRVRLERVRDYTQVGIVIQCQMLTELRRMGSLVLDGSI